MNREEKMIVALTGCSHALSHSYLLIFPAVLLLLQKEFSMGYLGLGVIGNIMVFAYGLGALPGGMIYNRLGPRKLYLLCFLGSAVASFLIALTTNFFLFTAGLALLGALGSVYHPLANALITSRVKEYGRALGIHGAAGNIGLAGAPFLAALIGAKWGWRAAYLLFAIPGIALTIWSLTIKMDKDRISTLKQTSSSSPPPKIAIFFSLPLILIYLLNMLHSFSYHGAITFLPAYMGQYTSFKLFSWDSVTWGGMLSGLALFVGVFGQYMGGILGQRKDAYKNFLIICILCLPFVSGMALFKDATLFLMSLGFFFLNFSLQPMTNVFLAQYTSPEMRGAAFGIFFFAAFGLGSFAASFSGYLAQSYGLPAVFIGLSIITLVLICFAFLLLRLRNG